MITAASVLADLPGSVVDWSATGLVALIVLLVLTDKLVPKSRLTDERREKELAQANSAKQLEINAELAAAVHAQNEAALLSKRVMEAVQEHHKVDTGGEE